MTPPETPGRTPRQPLATPDEVATYLRVETDTLRGWRRKGGGPAWTYVGGLCRYAWSDVDAYVESERKVPGGALEAQVAAITNEPKRGESA